MEKMTGETLNITEENIKVIAEHFPEAMEEGKIKFDVLKELLGEFVDESNERYQFTWNGKSQALKLSQTSSTGTLLPCKEKSKDWDTTENIYIEGDNLEVLKLLQKSYYKKVKMIYIDPPYNTGNDFVYKDSFKDNIKNYKEMTKQECKANPETQGRYHTDWLNMIYPRLRLAKNLLANDGVIFISIDDNEQENMKKICNEIFGENNFVGTLIRKVMEGGKSDSKGLAIEHEYCHVYCKNNFDGIYKKKAGKLEHYNKKDEFFEERGYYYLKPLENGGLGYVPSLDYPIKGPDGVDIYPGDYSGDNGYRWVWGKDKFQNALNKGMIEFTKSSKDSLKYKVYYKIYEKVDTDGNPTIKELPFGTLYLDGYTNRQAINDLKKIFDNNRVFDYPKPVNFLKEVLKIGSKDGDIVMDFFSGSGSFAQAVLELNEEENSHRNFILVQIPENIRSESNDYKTLCDIGEDRIRRAENKRKEETNTNIDYGFKVFKLDSSNLKIWNGEFTTEEEANNYFLEHLSPVVDGRTNEDLLYELLLKEGMPLTSPIEEIKVGDKTIYSIGMGYLMTCLEEKIDMNLVEEIGKRKPESIIFRDSGFVDENLKINAIQELKKYGIAEEVIKSI